MTRPLEVGLVVADLLRSLAFYVDALGCSAVRRSDISDDINGPAGLGGRTTVVWLQTPTGERLKLIQPVEVPSPGTPALPLTARQGLSYLTFYVENVEPVSARLRAHGARAMSGPEFVNARDKRISFWIDPDGVVVELVDLRGDLPAVSA